MNNVLNFSISPRVFLISEIANFADDMKSKDGISFSIGGSGTNLKVTNAKPYHQIPDDAITKGITHSPVKVKTIPR